MCGSGTIVIEAALMATDTAPGIIRYEQPSSSIGKPNRGISSRRSDAAAAPLCPNPLRWVDLAEDTVHLWKAMWSEATQRDKRAHFRSTGVSAFVFGNDIHPGAINLAKQAAVQAGVQHITSFTVGDVAQYRPASPICLYVTNPPWGNRLDDVDDAAARLVEFTQSENVHGNSQGNKHLLSLYLKCVWG